ncbi:hypothetical protein FUAX_44340 (plasmid) [Fulvitalea axinellae]|uniref:Uncharacterized protein n=1 Tax=Fulvitalea axinellae TaxID=1182444 RepID=A0AAU9CYG4_9BACT|nr:hypothetical protein FUAX_44340 [Fulvitalea axinellae]
MRSRSLVTNRDPIVYLKRRPFYVTKTFKSNGLVPLGFPVFGLEQVSYQYPATRLSRFTEGGFVFLVLSKCSFSIEKEENILH